MNRAEPITEVEAGKLAKKLIDSYADRAFEISMPDQSSYEFMRGAFSRLGRSTGPDGEFFVVKVFAVDHAPA
jgi:hypothetical protein